MQQDDGCLVRVEAAHGARRRIGDIPQRGVVVVRVREVHVRHCFGLSLGSPYLLARGLCIIYGTQAVVRQTRHSQYSVTDSMRRFQLLWNQFAASSPNRDYLPTFVLPTHESRASFEKKI